MTVRIIIWSFKTGRKGQFALEQIDKIAAVLKTSGESEQVMITTLNSHSTMCEIHLPASTVLEIRCSDEDRLRRIGVLLREQFKHCKIELLKTL